MEASNASADAAPSSVTLASLPAELHSLIARMCRDQDRRYSQRTLWHTEPRQLKVAKAGASDWDGRSLNALFLVSRDWSKVAAAYVFETIFSTGCSDLLFDFDILPQYASVVRHASFNSDYNPDNEHVPLLRILPFLPRLRRLTLPYSTFITLLGFGSDSTPSPEHILHRKSLLRSIQSLSEISLIHVEAKGLTWLLEPLANSALRRLDFTLNFGEDISVVAAAREALARLKGLQHLSLRGLSANCEGLLSNASTFDFRLRSLELAFVDRQLDSEAWSCIEASASTLESLSLRVLCHDGTEGVEEALREQVEGEQGAPSTAFPALRHLCVEGTASDITTILKLYSHSPVATLDLRLLDYDHRQDHHPFVAMAPVVSKLWRTSLRRLDASIAAAYTSSPPYVTTSVITKVRRELAQTSSPVDFTAEPRYDPFYHQPRSTQQDYRAVAETLGFALDYSKRLHVTEDSDGQKALLNLLLPLRGKMLREKD